MLHFSKKEVDAISFFVEIESRNDENARNDEFPARVQMIADYMSDDVFGHSTIQEPTEGIRIINSMPLEKRQLFMALLVWLKFSDGTLSENDKFHMGADALMFDVKCPENIADILNEFKSDCLARRKEIEQQKNQKKFDSLLGNAIADGIISDEELSKLIFAGKQIGKTEEETKALVNAAVTNHNVEETQKLNKMVAEAVKDGKISDTERQKIDEQKHKIGNFDTTAFEAELTEKLQLGKKKFITKICLHVLSWIIALPVIACCGAIGICLFWCAIGELFFVPILWIWEKIGYKGEWFKY